MTTRPAGAVDPVPSPDTPTLRPYRLSVDDVVSVADTEARTGLTASEARRRLDEEGPNRLVEPDAVPTWRRILAQFTDTLILILIAAAVVAFVVSGELKTPVVVLVVVVVNAIVGFVQENRAERSLEALEKMLVVRSTVRRDGDIHEVDATELVRGDIVLLEPGDRVPADGRLMAAKNLEVDESPLTGESQPVTKQTEPIDEEEVGVGDRTNMVHMNTAVTRGRGEMVVTATAMRTEIGRIAALLRSTRTEKTPLQRQLDGLAHSLARLAGVIVALVFVIGLVRGQSVEEMLLTSVALAVAAIPEGLPAVTALTLAIGVSKMAQQNAIVKHLASVETLGSTDIICSDKTGTLTLNEMTAVELFVGLRRHAVTGLGYAPSGTIERHDDDVALLASLEALALCSDATLRKEGEDWHLIGDPTEGALVTLAAKAGIDAAEVRRRHPRIGEIPFESATKYMATLHRRDDDGVDVFVKGAPDVLSARTTQVICADGTPRSFAEEAGTLREAIDDMGARGLRVLAVAGRTLGRAEHRSWVESGSDPDLLVRDLEMVALVAIVDPPRSEARDAITEARAAGIDVKMITGDHGVTAAAIARDLGLGSAVLSGAELDRLDDADLADRLDATTVFARVSPEHKIRLVGLLQRRGAVVAMTGDGVNDAPALKKADIGIAMGITGTEVSKEAATMVLADDNFATIVGAVRRGRTIYDNIVKFVRFQLSTTLGFAAVFLGAAILGIADGAPFTAIAILWVNIVMDGPPAMALGVDRAAPDVMERRPRPLGEPILTRPRWSAIGVAATVMAVGTLAVLALGPGAEPEAGVATVAGTMAFNTFVLFQFFNLLNARSDTLSVFGRHTLTNRWLWVSLSGVVALQLAVTHLGPMQDLFDTTSISAAQWAVCVVVASTVLVTEEARKLSVRLRAADS